jgi:hypothetical protein
MKNLSTHLRTKHYLLQATQAVAVDPWDELVTPLARMLSIKAMANFAHRVSLKAVFFVRPFGLLHSVLSQSTLLRHQLGIVI